MRSSKSELEAQPETNTSGDWLKVLRGQAPKLPDEADGRDRHDTLCVKRTRLQESSRHLHFKPGAAERRRMRNKWSPALDRGVGGARS